MGAPVAAVGWRDSGPVAFCQELQAFWPWDRGCRCPDRVTTCTLVRLSGCQVKVGGDGVGQEGMHRHGVETSRRRGNDEQKMV